MVFSIFWFFDSKKKLVLNSFASTVLQKYFIQKKWENLSCFSISLHMFFCYSANFSLVWDWLKSADVHNDLAG